MEKAEKTLMDEIIQRKKKSKPWTDEEIFKFWYQLVQVFAFCSYEGISHNDIKPTNILLKNGVPKVSDFGTSQQFHQETAKAMQDNFAATNRHIYMTPLYASPNVCKKAPKINYFIEDVFSLGMTFLQMALFASSAQLEELRINIDPHQKALETATAALPVFQRVLLQLMLRFDAEERPNFLALMDIFDCINKVAFEDESEGSQDSEDEEKEEVKANPGILNDTAALNEIIERVLACYKRGEDEDEEEKDQVNMLDDFDKNFAKNANRNSVARDSVRSNFTISGRTLTIGGRDESMRSNNSIYHVERVATRLISSSHGFSLLEHRFFAQACWVSDKLLIYTPYSSAQALAEPDGQLPPDQPQEEAEPDFSVQMRFPLGRNHKRKVQSPGPGEAALRQSQVPQPRRRVDEYHEGPERLMLNKSVLMRGSVDDEFQFITESVTAVTPNGEVFVLGGRKKNAYMATTIELKFMMKGVVDKRQAFPAYDPTVNCVKFQVIKRKPMNEKRGFMSVTATNKELFVIGGCDQYLSSAAFEVFDIKNDRWKKMAQLKVPREQCSSCFFRQRELYVFGGISNTLESLTAIAQG